MAKFDGENLLDAVKAIMVNGLNAKVLEVENEKIAQSKGLTPTLKQFGANSYFEQTWNAKILNANPAIFYGIEDVQSTDGGGALGKVYQVFVEVVLVDNGMQNDNHKRIQRYSRALEELFLSADATIIPYAKIKVNQVRPISFKLQLDSNEEIKVGGISILIALV